VGQVVRDGELRSNDRARRPERRSASLIDHEAQANPAFLDPGNLALADESPRHHKRSARHEGRVSDIDGGALERDIRTTQL